MKKILVSIFLIGIHISLSAQNQVSNSGFENWTLIKPAYNFYAPDNWSTGSVCASFNEGEEACQFFIQQTTDAYEGKYAVSQFTIDNPGSKANYSSFGNFAEGFTSPAFTGRPKSVTFYYKYTTNEKLEMDMSIMLYTGSLLGDYEIIAASYYSISESTKGYVKVNAPFSYLSSSLATNILITSNYPNQPVNGFDTLKLDSFVFNYTTTDVDDVSSPEYFSVSVANKILTSSKIIDQVTFIDLSGKSVASFNGEQSEFNLSDLKSGVYILKGMLNGIPVTRKLFVE